MAAAVLADLICGDETTPYYRTGRQITALFDAAGWRRVGKVDGPRRAWVLDTLQQRYAPDDDIVRIAWNVVVAALNDLEQVKS